MLNLETKFREWTEFNLKNAKTVDQLAAQVNCQATESKRQMETLKQESDRRDQEAAAREAKTNALLEAMSANFERLLARDTPLPSGGGRSNPSTPPRTRPDKKGDKNRADKNKRPVTPRRTRAQSSNPADKNHEGRSRSHSLDKDADNDGKENQ